MIAELVDERDAMVEDDQPVFRAIFTKNYTVASYRLTGGHLPDALAWVAANVADRAHALYIERPLAESDGVELVLLEKTAGFTW
ncbi:MAG: hypothetical protein QM619_14320 [Micropruina sp.]|uniref:hypothetical protein n=1 Tax=Micropruina sp. TaxID=2737536 RepID=UPI0039E27BAC